MVRLKSHRSTSLRALWEIHPFDRYQEQFELRVVNILTLTRDKLGGSSPFIATTSPQTTDQRCDSNVKPTPLLRRPRQPESVRIRFMEPHQLAK